MYCPNCHSEIEAGDRFCPGCGLDLEAVGLWQQESMAMNGSGPMIADESQYMAADEPEFTTRNEQESWEREDYYEETQKTHKKNKKSKTPLLIVALLIAAAAIGAGAFAVKHFVLDGKDSSGEEKQEAVVSDEKEEAEGKQEKKKRITSDAEENKQEAEQEDDAETDKGIDEVIGRETAVPDEEVDIADVTVAFIDPPSSTGNYSKLQPKYASSSSELVQEDSDANDAWAAMDGRTETSWQEGVDGDGIGQELVYSFSGEVKVKYLTFCLGNWRSADYAEGNNRPKKIKVTVGELEFEVEFPKEQQEYWLELSSPVPANEVSFEIESVYKGTKWDDTCIAELGIYGK